MVNNNERIHFVVRQDTEVGETEMPLLEGEIQTRGKTWLLTIQVCLSVDHRGQSRMCHYGG